MAVVFNSRESEVVFEVGEYQQFPKPEEDDAPADPTAAPKVRHLCVVLASFGLLCVLQAVLNVSLRLGLREPTLQGGKEERCPPGWLAFSLSCYYISSQRSSWDDSRLDCLQKDADLVIIDSRQEQAFLTGFALAAWVGMTDRQEEGTWLWVDGTLVDKDRLLWAPGQPDGAYGGEDCGDLRTMMTFIGLNDFNCSARAQWICEKSL